MQNECLYQRGKVHGLLRFTPFRNFSYF